MNYDAEIELKREISVKRLLFTMGWTSLGCWIFMAPGGTVHDLSAADFGQLERIEREGLFLVAQ